MSSETPICEHGRPYTCPACGRELAAKDARIAELEEEARQVCGALGEFYASGGGTTLEKIVFFREDNRVTRAENERLRGDLRAATGELMDLAHSKPRPIRFYEEDGTERVLEWEDGDESAGILAGYVLTDASDSEYAKLQTRLVERDAQLCRARKLLTGTEKFVYNSIKLEQPSFDMPPEPRSQWDHEASQVCGAIQDELALVIYDCPHEEEAKRLREAVEWIINILEDDRNPLFSDNPHKFWAKQVCSDLRRRMKEGK